MKFHDAGYEHGKFFEHNILFKSDSPPTIIDLENAKEHICSREREFGISPGDVAPPDWSEYGCKEIYDYASKSGIWNQGVCCLS